MKCQSNGSATLLQCCSKALSVRAPSPTDSKSFGSTTSTRISCASSSTSSSYRHPSGEHRPTGSDFTAARRRLVTEARKQLRYGPRDERVAGRHPSIPEVPGAHSQGRSREEARSNVVDALRGILELRFGEHPEISEGTDSERLELVIGA